MRLFVAIGTLICASNHAISTNYIYNCSNDVEINLRSSEIIQFESINYRICKNVFYDDTCKKIQQGCRLELNKDRVYISKYSCTNYKE